MTVHLSMAYLFMLVSITLTSMQGHSRSAKAKIQHLNYLEKPSKQQALILLDTTVVQFLGGLGIENVNMAGPCYSMLHDSKTTTNNDDDDDDDTLQISKNKQ